MAIGFLVTSVDALNIWSAICEPMASSHIWMASFGDTETIVLDTDQMR
jgi:hypothetical protein